MQKIVGTMREEMQITCLEENIKEDDIIRVIDVIVEELDFKKLGYQEKERKSHAGRPGYDIKVLCKLFLLGYLEGIHSGRKLEKACKYNLRFQWLLGKQQPDANTINDFRKNNIEMLKNMFYEVNRLYIKLGILKLKDVSQDGFKIKASNSKEKNYTVNKIADRIKREIKSIKTTTEELKKLNEEQETINNYLNRMEASEKLEELEEKIAIKEKELKEIEERKEKHEEMLKEMKEKEVSQISLTDKESKLMKNNGKFEVCYNNQTAVDMETHLTVAIETDNNPADVGSMSSLMSKIEKEYGREEIITDVTDKGYQSTKDMMECLEMGIVPQVTPNDKSAKEIELETEYEENEIKEEMKKSQKSEDIKRCLRAGVIPECYEGIITEIKIEEVSEKETKEEKEEETRSSEEIRETAIENQTFEKDSHIGCVYCPMGEVLGKKSTRKDGKSRYANKIACKNCKNPCTKCKYKEVEFGKNQKTLVPRNSMAEKPRMSKPKKILKKKVKVKLKYDREKLSKRMQTSEHSQGTMKSVDNYTSFHMRGKEKVSCEIAIHFTASNIRRVVNMIGVGKMLEKISEIDQKCGIIEKIKREFLKVRKRYVYVIISF